MQPQPATPSTGAATGASTDPYLTNDFVPLAEASGAVLEALRADEASPDADLLKRLASGGSGGHRYRRAVGASEQRRLLQQQRRQQNGLRGSPVLAQLNEGTQTPTAAGLNGTGNPQSPATGGIGGGVAAGNGVGVGVGTPASVSGASPFGQGAVAAVPPIRTPPTAGVAHARTVPLPPLLSWELSTTRLSSLMGLLPQAGLAWLSVDERLYVWSYERAAAAGSTSSQGGAVAGDAGEDFCSFAVPSGQCVVSVGLVRPKKGVFKEVVEWCLVVTTPEEVILCALAFESTATVSDGLDGTSGRHGTLLRLIPTRFVVPTDSVPILSVCGTLDGRIFLGGHDGCLYEMAYEGLFNVGSARPVGARAVADDWDYDLDFDHYGATQGLASAVIAGGKRALSTVIFGPASSSMPGRPKKCRKINHTAVASGLVSSIVPGFVLRAASTIFGAGIPGGPIVSIAIDEERSTLYALTSKGFVHAFDLSAATVSTSGGVGKAVLTSSFESLSPPRLACTVDASKSARRYLDSVARGRMYPPSTSSSSTIASVSFPGGGAGAQEGVGGMDGARAILKIADAEQQQQRVESSRSKSSQEAASLRSGVLHPISISVVPRAESKTLTLVATTGGGLRYYLTVLSASSSSYGGSMASQKPGRRFTLCHVRAPPPYSGTRGGDIVIDSRSGGSAMVMNGRSGSSSPDISPGIHSSQRGGSRIVVEQGFSGKGVALLALDASRTDPNAAQLGNAIIAFASDYSKRQVAAPSGIVGQPSYLGQEHSSSAASVGITEVVSLPMVETSTSGDNPATLPGGSVWDIADAAPFDPSNPDSSACLDRLFFHSATPSNAELDANPVLAFRPLSRHRRSSGQSRSSEAHSSLEVARSSVRTDQGNGFVSSAVAVIYRLLLNQPLPRPLPDVPVSVAAASGLGKMPTYRIANRTGCGSFGFSVHPDSRKRNASRSSNASGQRATIAKSSRLSLGLLSPQVTPLSQIVSQHLLVKSDAPKKLLALNAGGMHFFDNTSVLDSLSSLLMKSTSSRMGNDENIRCFFESYGFAEGCAMCLSLAVFSDSKNLARRATQAALSFALCPSMSVAAATPTVASGGIISGLDGSSSGHVFQPSSIYSGLVSLVSRLLRPIWFKPAVVVTEGRTIHNRRYFGGNRTTLPAKVELLLDDETLEEVRKPIAALQALMKDCFAPAVDAVPGAKKKQSRSDGGDSMDVEGNGGSPFGNGDQHLITRAMQYQSRALPRNQTAGLQNSEKDLEAKARMAEERNLHSLYRLVSRTSQLLTLMSHLRRAQSTPELPEVEWGLLHGLTYCQLATTRIGQDRIETLLTGLVSSEDEYQGTLTVGDASTSAVEADNMSALLSQQCYLYFSVGSRLTYQGFRAANAALSYPPSTPRRVALANRAGLYFRAAARHWFNPSLVTGSLFQIDVDTNKNIGGSVGKWYVQDTEHALDNGSPLARAASVLVELGCVGVVVDICLICAGNFGGSKMRYDDDVANEKELIGDVDGYADDVLSWERCLYHGPLNESNVASIISSSGTRPVVSGIDVTNNDALRTCHAVLFHHLTELLNSANKFAESPALAEQMVAVCSSSPDSRFLHKLYEHLVDSGHVEFLLRIQSPTLEKWISIEKKDVFLLSRYYTLHGLDWLAGQAMFRHAGSIADKVPLKERIECLTRASNSFQAAQSKSIGKATSTGSYFGGLQTNAQQVSQPSLEEINRVKTQVDEQLDIACLQQRLLDQIMSSKLVGDLDASRIDALETSLVSVSDMYNEYAGPLALYDICLLILRTCHENDAASIVKLWRSVLCDPIIPCRTNDASVQAFLSELKVGSMLEGEDVVLGSNAGGSSNLPLFEGGDWIPKLKNDVAVLGKDLYGQGADYTFPLDLIVRTLEGLRQLHEASSPTAGGINGSHTPWTLQVLVDVGVPFNIIVDIYDSFVLRESAESGDTNAFLGAMTNVSEVLRTWVDAALHKSNRTVFAAGQTNFATNGMNDKDTMDASAQLYRAVSSGGLLARIDSYKSSLEGCVSGNVDDITTIMSSLLETENVIRNSFL